MSNHSSQQDPEMVEFFRQQLKKAGRMQQEINQLGLGATGEFPEGKLTQDDEGEIKIAITNYEGKVIINFGSQVTWIGFTPELAEAVALSLLEKAAKAKQERKITK